MKTKYTQSIKEGEAGEAGFLKIVESKNLDVRKATFSENVHKHIDYFVNEVAYDVKARKRVSRGNSLAQDEWVWLEFSNVRGRKGWLYGEAKYIAFETNTSFLIFDREKLSSKAEELVDLENIVFNTGEAAYNAYQRRGRKDIISRVLMKDLTDSLPFEEWKKNAN